VRQSSSSIGFWCKVCPANLMKAIVYRRYGPPDVLKLEEVSKPVPADKEVLIKVRAASVNPYDWHFMRGEPYLLRVMAGLRQPKETRLGADVAGHIEAVGKNVTQFRSGDEVFGCCKGAFAEYACASESKLAAKPQNVTFEQAASVPIAAITALQGLRDKGKIQLGHKVLINGASGGVGTFAVQIAKSFGAHVTAVCSTRNVQLVQSIGADRVVDYTQQDFTKTNDRYDILLDNVGNRSLSACRRLLHLNGIYIEAGGTAGRWMIGPLLRAIEKLLLSCFGARKLVGVFAKVTKEDLTSLGNLMQSGKLTPVIDRRCSLPELPEAIRHLEQGHARAKVVITV